MLVLASQSPRRHQILSRAGIPFVVRPANIDEAKLTNEAPGEHVRRLAREKAEAAAAGPGEVVLAADTVVVIDGQLLGKPVDVEDAVRMLRRLSGKEHQVMTGICLLRSEEVIVDSETTRVRFISLTEREISDYAGTGEPIGKAGAYAVQGLASKFIDRIEGCYFNVVGLPVALVYKYLRRFPEFSPLGSGSG